MLPRKGDRNESEWYEAGWGPMMSETAFFVKETRTGEVVAP
jgi:hypothetical protein